MGGEFASKLPRRWFQNVPSRLGGSSGTPRESKKGCVKDLYVSPDKNYVLPVLKVEAPSGYGLDNRFDHAKNKFEDFSFPCGSGNVEACENVKRVILEPILAISPGSDIFWDPSSMGIYRAHITL